MIKPLSLKISLLLSFFPALFVFLASGKNGTANLIATIITTLIIFITGLTMFKTGKYALYRKIFFSLYAFIFAIFFLLNKIDTLGHMYFTEADIILNNIDTCHIPIPSLILPAILSGDLLFPGHLDNNFISFAGQIFLWIIMTISIGKSWCSWGCFFGGFTDFFASILKKPKLTVNPDNIFIKWTPFLLMIFFTTITLFAFVPFFCYWICPFKCTTEFFYPINLYSWISLIISILMFLITVIILPILTKRRTFCELICPFGAIESIVGRISVFRIKHEPDKCIKCMKCVEVCPFTSITKESILKGKGVPGITCSMCGECVKNCPQKALYPGIVFQETNKKKDTLKKPKIDNNIISTIFTFNAFFFLVIMSNHYIYTLISRLISLMVKQ